MQHGIVIASVDVLRQLPRGVMQNAQQATRSQLQGLKLDAQVRVTTRALYTNSRQLHYVLHGEAMKACKQMPVTSRCASSNALCLPLSTCWLPCKVHL